MTKELLKAKAKEIKVMSSTELIKLEQDMGLSLHLEAKARTILLDLIDERYEAIKNTYGSEVEMGEVKFEEIV